MKHMSSAHNFNAEARRFHIGAVISLVTGKYLGDHIHKRKTELLAYMANAPENTSYEELMKYKEGCAEYLKHKFPEFKDLEKDFSKFTHSKTPNALNLKDPVLKFLAEKSRSATGDRAYELKAKMWLKIQETKAGTNSVRVSPLSKLDVSARQAMRKMQETDQDVTYFSPTTQNLCTLNPN